MGYIIKNGISYSGSNTPYATEIPMSSSDSTSVANKINNLNVITQTYTVATYGGTIKFTRQGNLVTVQAWDIGTTSPISTVGVITLLQNIDTKFLPSDDVYIAGFRSNGYSTDHFQGYRLRDTTQKTIISYVYTNKPINSGCFSAAYSV